MDGFHTAEIGRMASAAKTGHGMAVFGVEIEAEMAVGG